VLYGGYGATLANAVVGLGFEQQATEHCFVLNVTELFTQQTVSQHMCVRSQAVTFEPSTRISCGAIPRPRDTNVPGARRTPEASTMSVGRLNEATPERVIALASGEARSTVYAPDA